VVGLRIAGWRNIAEAGRLAVEAGGEEGRFAGEAKGGDGSLGWVNWEARVA